jgi:hypothetical protein
VEDHFSGYRVPVWRGCRYSPAVRCSLGLGHKTEGPCGGCSALSVYRLIGVRFMSGRRRSRSAGISFCALVALSALWLGGSVAAAQAVVQAPGFSRGPEVVSGGLLWAGSSSGHESVFLSTATATRVLVPDANLSEVRLDDGWVVVDHATGLKVGRLGRPLRAVHALARCPPIQVNPEGGRLEAVANGNLYAVVHASCLGFAGDAQFVVRVPLGVGTLHVLGRVSSDAISFAAAGSLLALTYEMPTKGRVQVELLDSRNAHMVHRLTLPKPLERGVRYRETQLDAQGDVLVSTLKHLPPPGSGESLGWWGNAKTQVARQLDSGFEPSIPGRIAYASLSDGRIAYASRSTGELSIDVLNLATDTVRTIVTFSGAARLEGFALDRTFLAWAQQDDTYITKPEGPPVLSCVTQAPVGSPELAETPLSAEGLPVIVKVSPGPRPAGPGCPPPP